MSPTLAITLFVALVACALLYKRRTERNTQESRSEHNRHVAMTVFPQLTGLKRLEDGHEDREPISGPIQETPLPEHSFRKFDPPRMVLAVIMASIFIFTCYSFFTEQEKPAPSHNIAE